MSKTIDERIVSMKFDNQQFEKNIQTSMGTINELKKSLNFDGITEGFDKVSKAVKNVDVSGISSAVEDAKNRISALEVVAITSVANIANSMVNSTRKLIRSITTEPIGQGFNEYELKMGAVQTIMASTGESIDKVNGYLDELNTYADKTIYSFSDMTNNIGKFTNSGVKLEDAVKAIQGVSNVAAVSGANANEASRAMYNFAQALSSGSVKFIDWKSIEIANMATSEFKQSLIDTAVAMGTVAKVGDNYISTTTNAKDKTSDVFNATTGFNESLQAQWMTTEVLVQTLSNYSTDIRDMSEEERKAYQEKLRLIGYTEDQITAIEELGKKAFDSAKDIKTFSQLMDTLQESVGSGWAYTFEILFGNLEEAKILWTAVSDVVGGYINESARARNELLQGWKDLGGRQALIESIKNIFEAIVSVVKPIRDAFREVFPPTTSEQLYKATDTLRVFTSKLILSEENVNNLKETFKGLFSVLDICKKAFIVLAKPILELIKNIFSLNEGTNGIVSTLLKLTGHIGKWITEFDEFISTSDAVKEAIEKIEKALRIFADAVKEVFDVVSHYLEIIFEKAKVVLKPLLDDLKIVYNEAPYYAEMIFEKIEGALIAFSNGVKPLFEKISSYFDAAFKSIKDFADQHFNMPDLSGLEHFSDKIKELLEPVKDILDKVKAGLGNVYEFIKSLFDKFIDLLHNFVPFIKTAARKIEGVLEYIGNAFVRIFGGNGLEKTLSIINSGLLVGIGIQISNFLSVMKSSISNIPKDLMEHVYGLFNGVVAVMDDVRNTLVTFQEQIKAEALKKIATAVAILVTSIFVLSLIDPERLSASLASITVLFGELFLTLDSIGASAGMKSKKSSERLDELSDVIIKISASMLILSIAVGKIASIDSKTLKTSVGSVMLLIATLAAAVNYMSKNNGSIEMAGSTLITFSAAILILSFAMKKIGDLDRKQIAKGLSGVGVLIGEILILMKLTQKINPAIDSKFGLAIIEIAIAINILQSAVSKLGELKDKTYAKGLSAMAIIIAELSVLSLSAQSFDKGSGMAIVEIAIAVFILQSAVKKLGELKVTEAVQGILAIGIVMQELTIVAKKAKNNVGNLVGLLALAAAIRVLVPSIEALGKMKFTDLFQGIFGLSSALIAFAVAMKAMSGGLKGALALSVMSAALALFIPVLVLLSAVKYTDILKGVGSMLTVFAALGLAAAILSPALTSIVALSVSVFALGTGFLMLSSALLIFGAALGITVYALINLGSLIGEALEALGKAIIYAVERLLPDILELIAKLIINVLVVLDKYSYEIIVLLIDFVDEVLAAINDRLPEFIYAAMELIITFIRGLASAVYIYGPELASAVDDLIMALLEFIVYWFADFGEKGAEIVLNIMRGFKDGCLEFLHIALEAFEDLGNAIIDFFKSLFGIHSPSTVFEELGENVVQGLANGIRGLLMTPVIAIRDLANAIIDKFKEILHIDSPSKVFDDLGVYCALGLANGIRDSIGDVLKYVKEMALSAVDAVGDYVGDAVDAGKNFAKGFGNAIEDKAEYVSDKAESLGKKAKKSLKKVLRINSPSKETYELGRYFDEGFADGISDYSKLSENQSELVGKKTMDLLHDTMDSAMNSDYEPVIRPVFDMSNIESGGRYINDIFNQQRAIELAGDIGANRGTSPIDYLKDKLDKLGNYSSIIESINKLHSDISELSNAVQSMQIVLDSGVVAGELDIQLGAINSYKERWN